MALNIVLTQPSIIENVGNICRTCLGFNMKLHMVRPYGFIWNKAKLNRSSTNHIDEVEIHQYDDWQEFMQKTQTGNAKYYFYTRYGTKTPSDFKYDLDNEEIYLVFGNEHYGIDKQILKANLDTCVRIPMSSNLICLNISNSVAIASYEVMKQNDYKDLSLFELFNKEW